MIMGGMFDLVTPIEAMTDMSHHIPNNFFYMDMHLSHHVAEKPNCAIELIKAFLNDADDSSLRAITMLPACTEPPRID